MRTRRRLQEALLTLLAAFALAGVPSRAWSKGKGGAKAHKPPAPSRDATASSDQADQGSEAAASEAGDAPASGGKGSKPKVYNFSGLDLEGRLKTPQLLYFLNRVKVELDSTNNAKRSFMKDLERSADDKGL